MRFAKMQGAGNSFVLTLHSVKEPERLARFICKIASADGLIIIKPSDTADFAMEVYNADGSPAEMCGNGIRCLGKYVYDKGLTFKRELKIETDSGIRQLYMTATRGTVTEIQVNMGAPEIIFSRPVEVPGLTVTATFVNVGNPHAVIFTDDLKSPEITHIGSKIETCPIFPGGTNVETARIISRDRIEIRIWERGCGETMACGTGSVAVAAAAIAAGYCGDEIKIDQPGGTLNVCRENDEFYLTGTAGLIFEFTVPDNDLP
jgi:diaminopimelate epimerase